MKSVTWYHREREVRYAIVRDMIRYGWLTASPISQQRDTTELVAEKTTRNLAVAEHETITMNTEAQ